MGKKLRVIDFILHLRYTIEQSRRDFEPDSVQRVNDGARESKIQGHLKGKNLPEK